VKSLQIQLGWPPQSAFADLAECGPNALFGLLGLLLFAAPPLLIALHRRQKPPGFQLGKYHDDSSFPS